MENRIESIGVNEQTPREIVVKIVSTALYRRTG